jgi:MoxR-like ATPase
MGTVPIGATFMNIRDTATAVLENIGQVIVGKEEVAELVLVALLCEGHVLIEDVPGIGKTTLAKTIARSLGCTFSRIQFTPDLLPSDVLTRSTAPRPARRARCWRPCKNGRSPWTA